MNCTGETFNDVMFVPQYSEIEHRKDISTTTNMGKFVLELPLISANMKDITGPKMAAKMAMMGGLGILHRFAPEGLNHQERIEYALDQYKQTKILLQKTDVELNPYTFGVSVGVQESDKERFEALFEAGACLFTVDVAHGHHLLVKNMIEFMRNAIYGKDICIIAGNVATEQAAGALKEWGADIVKIGIGPGSVCETRKNTGVGVPQLKAIRAIRNAYPDLPTIADGGIKYYGDLPKALKYSNAVMVGSLIAGTTETPGHVYQNDKGEFYKVYGGSASGERKVENGGNNSFVEGVIKLVPFRGKVKYIIHKSSDSIRSSMSYSGANNLEEFRSKAIMADIGSGGRTESKL
jgi:IMP dehydrogenase